MQRDYLKSKKMPDSSNRTKNVKNQVEESLPFAVRPDRVSASAKKLIFQLEQEYIKRYNILMANRQAFTSIVDSMATELDSSGLDSSVLLGFFKEIRNGISSEQKTQAE